MLINSPITASQFEDNEDGSTKTLTRPSVKTKKPKMYKVLLLNDDFTPMDFVLHVLMQFFKKNAAEASEIMLNVHHKGSGLCGLFSYEVAETKVQQVNSYAKINQHPLKCTLEAE